ncbi:maestro heat-like repeat-containing protein family member 1 [Thomomys bottae]
MPVVMVEQVVQSPEWSIRGKSMEYILEALQVSSQLPPGEVLESLKVLAVRILNNKMSSALCQKVADIIINYLRKVTPGEELEEISTVVLTALGSHYPGTVIIKLLDRSPLYSLPPRSLLVAVGKLNLSPGAAAYIGATWEHVLGLLRVALSEKDRLALCQVLSGLALNARKQLDLGPEDAEAMDTTLEAVSIRAYLTLRVLFNRWPLQSRGKVTEQALIIMGHLFFLISPSKLRNQVNWLIRRLMALASVQLEPFYISQCLCQLLGALEHSGYGGVNLESQVENITNMLLVLMHVSETEVSRSVHSVQCHILALQGFYILTKLYSKHVVVLLLKSMASKDSTKTLSALQVFQKVFREVVQTEVLKNEVMNSVILVIQEECGQEDPTPAAPLTCRTAQVRTALLGFVEILAEYGYLLLPQGNVVISYVIRLSQWDFSHEEDMQLLCLRILKMIPLPKLVTFLCHPTNLKAFLILSKAATEIALQSSALGHFPYLVRFHRKPTQVTSPQSLFTQLVLFALKPYRQKLFGVRSLKLLSALHPITSLHPVINSCVGQLWKKAIPEMLQILDDYGEKNLNQRKWELRLLQFSSQSLVAISNDSWMEQLTVGVLSRITFLVDNDEEKAFLYQFLGYTMSTTNNPRLVKRILWSILNTSHQELLEREGIAVAFSIVSLRHLQVVLDEVQEYGAALTDQNSSPIPQTREGDAAEGVGAGVQHHLLHLRPDHLGQHGRRLQTPGQHPGLIRLAQDENLKLCYLETLSHLTSVLSQQHILICSNIPHKLEIVDFMVDVIRSEPINTLSSPIRQMAMSIITDFRKFKPILESESRAELLRTCCRSVLALPPSDIMKKEASTPGEGLAVVELFRVTMYALQMLMEAIVIEEPSKVSVCLEMLDPWLNSHKDNERERAVWCTARVLRFTAQMNNFEVEIQFPRLGRLVRMLAIRCQDSVDNISFLSSQAVYSLYSILLLQKQMLKKKQGTWEEEEKTVVYSAHVFHNNTYKIAKAFAEHFTQIQVTNLVLTAMEGLTDSKLKTSLAAAQLMNAVMKERGRDVIKIGEVVEGILERLHMHLEPSTKEETLQAMCALAGSNTPAVVPMLLSKSLPWDRTKLALWKAFGAQRETAINILQVLIAILEKKNREETKEMALQPVAAVCALYEMLSGQLCHEAIQELYPRLLLAVLCHLYWVMEQNIPQKLLIYAKEEASGSRSKHLDPTRSARPPPGPPFPPGSREGRGGRGGAGARLPCSRWKGATDEEGFDSGRESSQPGALQPAGEGSKPGHGGHLSLCSAWASCALEVVRLVLLGAAYESVVVYARAHHYWDLLSSPKSYYIGMMGLASGIVKKCETDILHRILNHIRSMLYSADHRQRLTARTLYVQLLWHRSVAEVIGADCMDDLVDWLKEPSLIMKEIGLRGISNLALHPTQSKQLKSLVPFLRTFLRSEARVTVQAVKSLRNIIYHRLGEDSKLIFCSVSRQLCPLINDERDQVRVSATSALGHMLHRLFQFKPGVLVRKEIYIFLVPLLLSIQDNNVEVVKACRGALAEWTTVIGWSSLTQMFRHTTLSDHIQVLEETCKFLVTSGRLPLVGDLLTQSFSFLRSPQVFLRMASLNFIELTLKNIQMAAIHEDDVEQIQLSECLAQPGLGFEMGRAQWVIGNLLKGMAHSFLKIVFLPVLVLNSGPEHCPWAFSRLELPHWSSSSTCDSLTVSWTSVPWAGFELGPSDLSLLSGWEASVEGVLGFQLWSACRMTPWSLCVCWPATSCRSWTWACGPRSPGSPESARSAPTSSGPRASEPRRGRSTCSRRSRGRTIAWATRSTSGSGARTSPRTCTDGAGNRRRTPGWWWACGYGGRRRARRPSKAGLHLCPGLRPPPGPSSQPSTTSTLYFLLLILLVNKPSFLIARLTGFHLSSWELVVSPDDKADSGCLSFPVFLDRREEAAGVPDTPPRGGAGPGY